MTNSLTRYVLAFLIIEAIMLALIALRAPPGSFLYISIFSILTALMLSLGVYVSIRVKKMKNNLEGNTREILSKFLASTITIVIYLVLRTIAGFINNKLIEIPNIYFQIIEVTAFTMVLVYFYIVYDVVSHLKTIPKLYDSSKRKELIEEDE